MSRFASSACPVESADGAGEYSSSLPARSSSSRRGEDRVAGLCIRGTSFSVSSERTISYFLWWKRRLPRRRHCRLRRGCSRHIACAQQPMDELPACWVDEHRKE
eukprot:6213565-Pleurochrysis_carterae.AAC.6